MTDRPALGVAFCMLDGPRDPGALADAIVAFYAEHGSSPERLTMSAGGIKHRKFKPSTFRRYVEDPEAQMLTVWSEREPSIPRIRAFLRTPKPLDDFETRFQSRWVTLTAATLPLEVTGPALAFIEAVVRLYPVAHGAVGGYRALRYAVREFTNSASVMTSELDDETVARLGADQMRHTLYRDKLLRLYPVTIIGPDIWAALPPLPAFDPMPTVEDLGDCKLLTAWPTLCEPRDPAFLRGTRALREWLWPYTIQNPADHVDNDPA